MGRPVERREPAGDGRRLDAEARVVIGGGGATSQLNRSARRFFDAYIECWNGRDVDELLDFFDGPATFVTPAGTAALPDRPALHAFLSAQFEAMSAAGFGHSEFASVEATACGAGIGVLEVRGLRRIRVDGSLLEEIDGHYVVRMSDATWRFIVVVLCEKGWREARNRSTDS